MTNATVNLYDHAYGDFAGAAEEAVRRETYGVDLGQTSWLTATEWLGFADQLGIGASSNVLEVGSGSGGPGLYLAQQRGCRLTGVDLNENGVRNAMALVESHGMSDRVQFRDRGREQAAAIRRRRVRCRHLERCDVPHSGSRVGAS